MIKNLLYILTLFINTTLFAQFGNSVVIDSSISTLLIQILSADIDRDGKMDIITVQNKKTSWYKNLGENFYTKNYIDTSLIHIDTTVIRSGFIDVQDVDNDGLQDIVSIEHFGSNYSRVKLFNNKSNGTNWTSKLIIDSIKYGAIKPYFVDMDNDSDLDIFVLSDGGIFFVKNKGNNNFENYTVVTSQDGEYYDLTFNDFNKDGFIDFAAQTTYGIVQYHNNQNSGFVKIASLHKNISFFIRSMDIDNDNDIDIISEINTGIAIFKNDGKGTFTYFDKLVDVCGCTSLLFSNFSSNKIDGDNYIDFISTNIQQNSKLFLRKNNGQGSFSSQILIDSSYLYTTVSTHDIDGDQDQDVLWCRANNNGGFSLGYFKNTTNTLSTSALNEPKKDVSTYIYPNPAENYILIDPALESSQVKIYDVYGKNIGMYEESKIDIHKYNKGNYIAVIFLKNGGQKIEKFTKY